MANRLSAIATRTGDAGTTGLGDGQRVSKADLRVAAMGDIDELNSTIGLLLAFGLPVDIASIYKPCLLEVQQDLFDLGGELSIPGFTLLKMERVAALDLWLKDANSTLPRLNEFVLPGGSVLAAQAHVCRTVCRRAERAVVHLAQAQAINDAPRQYLNRLSDLLFVFARVFNRGGDYGEIQWNQKR